MCGFTETYGLGKWYAEPCRTGTWLVIEGHKPRAGQQTLYFRLHDHMSETQYHRATAIAMMREHNWKITACFHLKRIYSYVQDARYKMAQSPK